MFCNHQHNPLQNQLFGSSGFKIKILPLPHVWLGFFFKVTEQTLKNRKIVGLLGIFYATRVACLRGAQSAALALAKPRCDLLWQGQTSVTFIA